MLMMNSPDVGFSHEIALLRTLSLGKDRPNVMVMNAHASVDRVVEQLTTVCQAPIQVIRFPGVLDLLTRPQAGSQLEREEIAEIEGKVALGAWISRNEPLDVGTVELVTRQSGQRPVS